MPFESGWCRVSVLPPSLSSPAAGWGYKCLCRGLSSTEPGPAGCWVLLPPPLPGWGEVGAALCKRRAGVAASASGLGWWKLFRGPRRAASEPLEQEVGQPGQPCGFGVPAKPAWEDHCFLPVTAEAGVTWAVGFFHEEVLTPSPLPSAAPQSVTAVDCRPA